MHQNQQHKRVFSLENNRYLTQIFENGIKVKHFHIRLVCIFFHTETLTLEQNSRLSCSHTNTSRLMGRRFTSVTWFLFPLLQKCNIVKIFRLFFKFWSQLCSFIYWFITFFKVFLKFFELKQTRIIIIKQPATCLVLRLSKNGLFKHTLEEFWLRKKFATGKKKSILLY